jgi:hypothetical protein
MVPELEALATLHGIRYKHFTGYLKVTNLHLLREGVCPEGQDVEVGRDGGL